jgi:hypothetical protein
MAAWFWRWPMAKKRLLVLGYWYLAKHLRARKFPRKIKQVGSWYLVFSSWYLVFGKPKAKTKELAGERACAP